MPAGDNAPSDSHRRGGWSGYVLWPLLLLVLYLLSIGPVAKYYHDRKVNTPPRAVFAFYSPITWAYTSVPGFNSWLEWYLKVWGVHVHGG